MATSGEHVTYGDYEARTNRLAHLLRGPRARSTGPLLDLHGEQRRYLEMCAAGERAGLYYTASTRTSRADELAYISTTASPRR